MRSSVEDRSDCNTHRCSTVSAHYQDKPSNFPLSISTSYHFADLFSDLSSSASLCSQCSQAEQHRKRMSNPATKIQMLNIFQCILCCIESGLVRGHELPSTFAVWRVICLELMEAARVCSQCTAQSVTTVCKCVMTKTSLSGNLDLQ